MQWDDELFEVVGAEVRPQGGFRYGLLPWDEREIVRSVSAYPDLPIPPRGRPGPHPARVTSDTPWGKAVARIPDRWRPVIAGGVPAVLLGWFFPFRVFGEGMSALVHELGHTVVSWFFGRVALPAVIMTVTFQQSLFGAALVWATLIALAVRFRQVRPLRWPLVAVAAVYPVIAFTKLHEQAINAGGHGAEIALAAVFLLRALRGGYFVDSERPVWAFFGWYLWLRNSKLFFLVASSAAARNDYVTNAITGENDFVRVAHAAGLGLSVVAGLVFVVSASVPLLALVLSERSRMDPGGDPDFQRTL